MTRGAIALAVALPLAALGAWAVLRGGGAAPPGGGGSPPGLQSGPEVTLFDVDFREIREEGAEYKMS